MKSDSKKAKAKVKSAKKGSQPKPQDATALLRADHKLVSGLFSDYEKSRSLSKKKHLVEKICRELSIHAQLEEEIFYPAFEMAVKDTELVPEATVEHASLKDLIAQLEGAEPDSELFEARVKVLSEYVRHHVKEEQNEMFAKAKSSDMDLVQLGDQIASRKLELQAERSLHGSIDAPRKLSAA